MNQLLKYFAIVVVSLAAGAFLHAKYLSKPAPPAIAQSATNTNSTADTHSTAKTVKREFNCANGALSKETIADVETVKKDVVVATESELIVTPVTPVENHYLALKIGGGAQIQNLEHFEDVFRKMEIKPQIAAGLEYDGYEAIGASDLKSNHTVLLMKSFKMSF